MHEPARNIGGHSEQTYDGKQIHELVHGTLLAIHFRYFCGAMSWTGNKR